ncbi:hypothetical protein LINGRAHAP2_LOCUS7438, partial [Linum grandiflorum]
GVRIQADALHNFAVVIQKRISVGSVYKITGFKLRPPRPAYRTCRFPHWLAFTALTKFELQPPSAIAFADELLEYVPLTSCLPACPRALMSQVSLLFCYFVGKVIDIGKSNYVERPTGVSPVQNMTVADASFTLNVRPITYVPPKFDTPEKLKQHVHASVCTLEELLGLYVAGGDADPAYRCDATIIGFEREKHWCYKACPSYSRAVIANGLDFWCSNHDTILSADVAYMYRLKVCVQDSTTTGTFVLLGMTAERILPF